MLEAVFFDLDNTLVLYDENAFYAHYFSKISKVFADLVPEEALPEKLIRATMALQHKDGTSSNADFFIDRFADGLAEGKDRLWQRFLRFYETEYDRIPVDYRIPSGIDSVIERAVKAGLKMVVASNPIFPETVQHKRIAWAGLAGVRFDWVTHIENMSYVKPRAAYFQQICREIATAPESCLMVGNDPVNDMAAAKAGLRTYLTEDGHKLDYASLTGSANMPQANKAPAPDYRGSLAGVVSVIDRLI